MRFRIGARYYSVRVTDGPIVLDGFKCSGVCLQSTREILIAGDCHPRERSFILFRELMRGWVFETGQPANDDGWHDLGATMTLGAIVDLNMQGGQEALFGLRAGESPERAAAKIGLTRSRACAVCRGDVAGGSVLCHPSKTPGIVDLALFCDHCNRTQRWSEVQSAGGFPSGQVVGEPVFEAGDKLGLAV